MDLRGCSLALSPNSLKCNEEGESLDLRLTAIKVGLILVQNEAILATTRLKTRNTETDLSIVFFFLLR